MAEEASAELGRIIETDTERGSVFQKARGEASRGTTIALKSALG